MNSRLLISADDIGLTKSNTDTILETVDNGPVGNVSILANGEALEYAVMECAKRKGRVEISIHFNLTVGSPISDTKNIPHLVDRNGLLRYSPVGLWIAYIFAPAYVQEALRSEVRTELQAQLALVRNSMSAHGLTLGKANGHQHVHMIPFVFDELIELSGITEVRITSEPFYFVPNSLFSYFSPRSLALIVFGFLGNRNRTHARKKNIAFNTHFLGLLFSGKMTYQAVQEGLARVAEDTEILFHPGSASSEEPFPWKESREEMGWQFSLWRERERELLKSKKLKDLFDSFQ